MIEIAVQRQVIERVNDISLTKVYKNDRKPLRQILTYVETFDETVPKLQYGFEVIDNYCYSKVRRWNEEFSVRKTYNVFISKEQRDSSCDSIQDVFITPSPSSGHGPVIVIQVDLMSWSETKSNSENQQRDENINFKAQQNQNVTVANNIDLAKVDRDDRKPMEKILKNMITFYETMPELTFEIIPKENHYNVIIRGWTEAFSVKKMYNKFLAKHRHTSCVPVLDITLEPKPESGRGPIMKIQVVRTLWNKPKKSNNRKKKKKKKNKKY